jgi:ribonuclease BN (tRNA processing enzyme)
MKIRKYSGETLPLNNDGRLTLFFIGVGSAFSKRQYQTNLLIVKGDTHILVDCGTKTPQAIYELGRPITDIENYLITHSHADHIGGLEEAMLMGRYVTRKKPTIIITKIYQNLLWDMSLRGGAGYNEEKSGMFLTFGDMWNIITPEWLECYPRETHEVDIGPINLKLFRTMHIPDHPGSWQNSFWSCGLIIDDRVMFTSDTRFDRELLDTFTETFKLEAIFHDCQFFTGGVHASLDELNTLPPEMKKKMILVHYGDNWEDFENKVKEYGFAGLGKQWKYYDFA